jgi:TDG/mug DNA glycosylase family protein
MGTSVRTQGFDPIADRAARVLILGTLPSQVSLQKGEYYAQPQNVFWKIMGDLFGVNPLASYSERTDRLISKRVALWDVCHSAHRPGSRDASIRDDEPNDFVDFLRSHEQLRLICFNGKKAANLYHHRVKRSKELEAIAVEVLPSTSAAHAAMPYKMKLARWSIVRSRCET